jgi:signal transduction histidine kinase
MLSLRALARPRTGSETFIVSLVVWNPVIAGALTFVFAGSQGFLKSWLVALAISDVVAIQCFLGVNGIARIERAVAHFRRRPIVCRSTGFHFLTAAGLMPLALPLGLVVGSALAHQLGANWDLPDKRSYRIGIGFGLVVTALFFFQRSRADAREAARVTESRIRDLENRRLQAQLAALTAEMNPHLLFNALNTVASLIHSDPDRAEEVVVQLADLYRGVLRSARSATHSLRDELSICEAYLKVEQARFGERLGVTLDIAPALDVDSIQVPVLILQPFVENAVKHGIAPRACAGCVRLEVRQEGTRILATIDDDGVGLGHSAHRGAGKAIANCQERLALTYGREAGLLVEAREGGGTRVDLWLPVNFGVRDATHTTS